MYIDFDGNRSKWHPAMATWCKGEVEKGNLEINAKNEEIAETTELYKTQSEECLKIV